MPHTKEIVVRSHLRLSSIHVGLVLGMAISPLFTFPALAQILPDVTLEAERSVVTPDVIVKGELADRIDGGSQQGVNLFHSFEQFNVGNGQRVYFANPGVENILTRVTGSTPSEILGTLGVEAGEANLFFLNPNGIVFGSNAKLDVNGSFVASTADGIQFGDQGWFSATDPEAPPLLTVNPSAFFFNQVQARTIKNQSTAPADVNLVGLPLSGLRVPDGRSLLLVGGDILMDGGGLHALGGRVELASVSGEGTIGLSVDGNNLSLSFPDDVARADISLDNGAIVNARAGGGGSIVVNAHNLNLAGSRIRTGILSRSGTVDSKAGDIEINATGVINLTTDLTNARSFISNSVLFGVGNAGDINIATESLFLSGWSFVGSSSFSNGDAGNLMVIAYDTVSAASGAFLDSNTFGLGDAGDVTINAGNLVSFDGVGSPSGRLASGVYSNVQSEAGGNGGEINITTGRLSVTNGAGLFANTFGQGNAGKVRISARDTVSFDDGFAFSNVGLRAVGRGGDVEITTGSLSVTNGAQLIANTEGRGDAGNVRIIARQIISFDGRKDRFSSAAFSRVNPGAIGRGGDVEIITGFLSVTNSAGLTAETFGQGDAGNVSITARETVSFDGVKDGFSSAAFSRVNPGAMGSGGDILVNARTLRISDGAILDARTFSSSEGGNIIVNLDALEVVNGGQLLTTTEGSGQAGKITVQAADLILIAGSDPNFQERIAQFPQRVSNLGPESGLFVRSEGTGQAGNIEVITGFIRLDDQGRMIAESASVGGGNIDLQVRDMLLLRRGSLISATAGTAQAGGDGGNIAINAPNAFIVAVPEENSDIAADAFEGNGGNVNITARNILGLEFRDQRTSLSDITASSEFGVAGEVNLETPDIDPAQGLIELPVNLTDQSNQIDQRCLADSGQGQSAFVVTGRGGVPPSPSEVVRSETSGLVDLATYGDIQAIASADADLATPVAAASTAVPSRIVEAQTWRVNDAGEIELIAQGTSASAPLAVKSTSCPVL